MDCLGDNDCDAGQSCRGHDCVDVVLCGSHRDCLPQGMLCDLASGQCVGCLADGDCDDDALCVERACVAVVCEVGRQRCGPEGDRQQCSARGTAWIGHPCPAAAVCRAGSCLPAACEPGEAVCTVEGLAVACGGDGDWRAPEACAAGEVCWAGHCTGDCLATRIDAETLEGEPVEDEIPAGTGLRLEALDLPPGADVRWELSEAPGGNLAWFQPQAGARTVTFLPGLAGRYRFRLHAEAELPLPLCGPEGRTIDVVPVHALRVELVWDTPADPNPYDGDELFNQGSDLDLHLTRGAAAFYTAPGDLYFANHEPDWGVAGDPADDPAILTDDVNGWGPEVVVLDPAEDDGPFEVGVHYYEDHDLGPSVARLRVWLEGALVHDAAYELTLRKELLDVGQVAWPALAFFPSGARRVAEGPVPCIDDDADGAGPGCAGGPDCAPADAERAEECAPAACVDPDGDGFGDDGACLGPDCAADDPGEALCLPCLDADEDGTGRGLSCAAPDCNDADEDVAGPCAAPCADGDGDGYGVGAGCFGPDCDDGDGEVHEGCPEPGCGDGVACPAGLSCDVGRGECYAADGSCSDAAPCPEGLQCQLNDGRGVCMGCGNDADCRPGQSCLLIMCMPFPVPIPPP